MADTLRSCSYLQNVFRDGQAANSITPQDVRDFIVSTMSISTGVVAAGNNQSNAATLSSRRNIVTNVASGTGVILTAGVETVISNRGLNVLAVYPPSGANIEKMAANVPLNLPVGQDATFYFDPVTSTQIYVVYMLNIANLGTTEPSASGIPWIDGGMISIS